MITAVLSLHDHCISMTSVHVARLHYNLKILLCILKWAYHQD